MVFLLRNNTGWHEGDVHVLAPIQYSVLRTPYFEGKKSVGAWVRKSATTEHPERTRLNLKYRTSVVCQYQS